MMRESIRQERGACCGHYPHAQVYALRAVCTHRLQDVRDEAGRTEREKSQLQNLVALSDPAPATAPKSSKDSGEPSAAPQHGRRTSQPSACTAHTRCPHVSTEQRPKWTTAWAMKLESHGARSPTARSQTEHAACVTPRSTVTRGGPGLPGRGRGGACPLLRPLPSPQVFPSPRKKPDFSGHPGRVPTAQASTVGEPACWG